MKSTIGIIGTGHIGKAVAANLHKSGRPYITADRKTGGIADALSTSEIIVLAIPFEAIGGFLKEFAQLLSGKIVIDPSNPIAPDAAGGFKKILEGKQSGGQVNAAFLPTGAKFAKALGTLGESSLISAAYQQPDRAVLFYASDDQSVDGEVEQLIRDIGFEPLKAGNINESIRLEVFGDLHEFGALGKPVTLDVAKTKI